MCRSLFSCYKYLLVICIIIAFAERTYSQQSGIRFLSGSTWNDVLAEARESDKMIFLDCYTTWCGPCKYLDQYIFPMPSLGDFFNKHFINASFDMEKEPGLTLKKTYGVTAYPTLLILNPRGYRINKLVGNPGADSLLAWAKKSEFKNCVTVEEDFMKGNRSATIVKNYFSDLISNNQLIRAQDELHRIVNSGGMNKLLEPKFWQILGIADPDSPETIFFLQNKNKFQNKFGRYAVEFKLATIFSAFDQLDRLSYPSPVREINRSRYKDYLKKVSDSMVDHYSSMKNVIDFYLACKNYKPAEANRILNGILGNGTDWEYYRVAKIAEQLTYDQAERDQYAVWAAKASGYITDPSVKEAILKFVANLYGPYRDNETHSHFELPDFDTPKTIF